MCSKNYTKRSRKRWTEKGVVVVAVFLPAPNIANLTKRKCERKPKKKQKQKKGPRTWRSRRRCSRCGPWPAPRPAPPSAAADLWQTPRAAPVSHQIQHPKEMNTFRSLLGCPQLQLSTLFLLVWRRLLDPLRVPSQTVPSHSIFVLASKSQ